jgi:hypothetical protein
MKHIFFYIKPMCTLLSLKLQLKKIEFLKTFVTFVVYLCFIKN